MAAAPRESVRRQGRLSPPSPNAPARPRLDVVKPPRARATKKLGRAFYTRDAKTLARDLVGKILVRKLPDGTTVRGRIVETEAYVGAHDLACHAAKGRTKRTEIMFGPGGHVYVYLIYGIHQMLNIVSGRAGDAQAVLIRAADPLDGWDVDLSGPGRLARGFHIVKA